MGITGGEKVKVTSARGAYVAKAMVTRRINAFDPVVITIAKIRAGTTTNVIPETVAMAGTLRAVSEGGRRLAIDGIERVATSIAQAYDMRAEVTLEPGYPVTVNDDEFAGFTLDVGRQLVGPGLVIDMPTPAMGAEDFSYVLQERPGALAFLGVCPEGQPRSRSEADASAAPATDTRG